MNTINVFIPAAGLGERLRPITDHIPKPLLPILGRPVLELVFERVRNLPVDTVGINFLHKGEMIRQWLEKNHSAENIRLFDEDPLLGTGGALKNAESLLGQKHFLVHNSDIVSDIDLGHIVAQHFLSKNLATLAIHDCEPFNTVTISREGLFESAGIGAYEGSQGSRRVAFTGIAVYAPEFLHFLPEGRSHVVDAWMKAVSAGMKIGTVDVSGAFWRDIGSPDAYATAVFDLLRDSGESLYVHPSVSCGSLNICGMAVMEENSRLSGTASLKNCIVLSGAEIKGPAALENTIVGNAYQVSIENPQRICKSQLNAAVMAFLRGPGLQESDLQPIGAGGSDRRYFRIPYNEGSAVLLICHADDPDFERQIAYTRFFRKYDMPVPDLIAFDKNHSSTVCKGGDEKDFKIALFEDLGDMSLYSWLKCARDPGRIKAMYKKILDILSALHTNVTAKSHECLLLNERIFDISHLRWETSYFLQRFVQGLRNVIPPDRQGLEEEFDRLALKVDGFGKTVVHRDFQSQNIMVTPGDIPRIIDYQGARIGPPAYDLASLLWDPYYSLDHDMREELVEHYITSVKTLSSESFTEKQFRETLLPCRLQRHMQALGAYAFLSSVKCKKYFLKYVPSALLHLKEETELALEEYPCLFHLVKTML